MLADDGAQVRHEKGVLFGWGWSNVCGCRSVSRLVGWVGLLVGLLIWAIASDRSESNESIESIDRSLPTNPSPPKSQYTPPHHPTTHTTHQPPQITRILILNALTWTCSKTAFCSRRARTEGRAVVGGGWSTRGLRGPGLRRAAAMSPSTDRSSEAWRSREVSISTSAMVLKRRRSGCWGGGRAEWPGDGGVRVVVAWGAAAAGPSAGEDRALVACLGWRVEGAGPCGDGMCGGGVGIGVG